MTLELSSPRANNADQTPNEAAGTLFFRRWAIPFAIAMLGLALNAIVATKMAPTEDESQHVDYGVSILKGSADRSLLVSDSKMPISVLNALPRGVGKFLRSRGLALGFADRMNDFRATRYPTIFAAFGLCLLVYAYAESLYGRIAGLLAQFVFVISPNIIAHSTVATTDLFIAAATILFLYSLRRFLLKPTFANTLLTAFTLALAQITKYTAVFLYPAALIVLVSLALYSNYGQDRRYHIAGRRLVSLLALHIVCFIFVINAAFVFDRSLTPLDKYEFHSATMKTVQQIPGLRAIPLPFPYAYVQGFDLMSYHNLPGWTFGNIVLLGHVRGIEMARSDGFPAYYLVAYILKVPLGMQLLFLLGLWCIVRRRRIVDFLAGEWPLLVTAGVMLLALSLYSRMQIGIRHILPVLVIFVILSGGAFVGLRTKWRRVLVVVCLIWTVVSVGSYYPRMIPYFNELVTDKTTTYRYLADSNLAWGQDRWDVQAFLKQNPDVVLDPPVPVTGRILVNANLLAGVTPKTADYWLRRNTPKAIGQVGYGHILFFIPAAH